MVGGRRAEAHSVGCWAAGAALIAAGQLVLPFASPRWFVGRGSSTYWNVPASFRFAHGSSVLRQVGNRLTGLWLGPGALVVTAAVVLVVVVASTGRISRAWPAAVGWFAAAWQVGAYLTVATAVAWLRTPRPGIGLVASALGAVLLTAPLVTASARADADPGVDGDRRRLSRRQRAILGAVVLVVGLTAGTVSTGLYRWHRDAAAHSRAGDACPVTSSGGVIGFDARSGKVLWTNVVPVSSRLSVRDGLIVARSSIDGTHQTAHWIDPATGAVRRCTTVGQAPTDSRDQVPLAHPITVAGHTITGTGGFVQALDATGTVVWHVERATPVLLEGDRLLAATDRSGSEGLISLDLVTGRTRWSRHGWTVASPEAGQPILMHSGDHVVALDPATGRAIWRSTLPKRDPPDTNEPVGHRVGDAYAFDTGPGGRLTVLDVRTGRIRWSADGGSPGRSRSAPVPGRVGQAVRSADGKVIVVEVDAFNPEFD